MNKLISANALYAKGEYEKAADLYLELAYEGDLDAMFNMGYMHQFGIGAKLDTAKAADFYAVAVYLEGGDAAYNLAVMTMNGIGVKRDIAKAVRYMEISANNGCPEAQLYLATACSIGYVGNPTVSNICRIPFHRAESRYNYASLGGYINDEEREIIEEERCRAITESQIDAYRWLSIVATNKDENDVYAETIRDAKYLFGLYNIEGVGCPINKKLGQHFIKEAALEGSKEAKQFLLSEEKNK